MNDVEMIHAHDPTYTGEHTHQEFILGTLNILMVHKCIHIHTQTNKCIKTLNRADTHTHARAHTHTHIHIHTLGIHPGCACRLLGRHGDYSHGHSCGGSGSWISRQISRGTQDSWRLVLSRCDLVSIRMYICMCILVWISVYVMFFMCAYVYDYNVCMDVYTYIHACIRIMVLLLFMGSSALYHTHAFFSSCIVCMNM
jgi:hypothetical protein